MSQTHHSESFLERWWALFVIIYALLFISLMIFFHPTR